MQVLQDRGALRPASEALLDSVPVRARDGRSRTPIVAVVAEPDRAHMTRELLGAAARLAADIDGHVVAISVEDPKSAVLAAWGADDVVHLDIANVEEDVAAAVVHMGPASRRGRSSPAPRRGAARSRPRVAARLDAGLTGDAVDLEVAEGRLLAWKPAFGGQLVAAIGATSPVQMATVRAGVISAAAPRTIAVEPAVRRMATCPTRGRVRVLARTRDDDIDALAEADVVIGIGRGVGPDEYDALEPLRRLLGAELGATRKVTDAGWLPRSRQIGITGRSIAPRLFVSIGASGKFNHTVGVRAAGTVLAINSYSAAPIFQAADVGIVADWRHALPLLVAELTASA